TPYASFALEINTSEFLTGKLFITLRVFSSDIAYSQGTLALSTLVNASVQRIPLVSLAQSPGAAAPANLTSVRAFQVILTTSQPSLDYSFKNGFFFECEGVAPLPVKYGYFKGQPVNGVNQLNWQTLSEID